MLRRRSSATSCAAAAATIRIAVQVGVEAPVLVAQPVSSIVAVVVGGVDNVEGGGTGSKKSSEK